VPLGAFLLLAAPWLAHGVNELDLVLIRGLLGPDSSGSPDSAALTERVRDLEVTRAHAVDDSAARLRSIERDLHDGAQAQLVALAMKLGLAMEKLEDKEKLGDAVPADLTRVAQLAIADRLVVSERAVEKHISNIFSKLGLPPSDSDHRRVLAVLAYLGS